MRLRAAVCLALGACSPPRPPSARVHVTPVEAHREVGARPLPRPPPVLPSRPTLANAGAETCRVGEAIELGPHGEGGAVLAFDAAGGLAVWKPGPTSLAVQPVALDGTKRGRSRDFVVPEGAEPASIRALDGRFLVFLRRWDLRSSEPTWWSFVAGGDGRIERPLAPVRAPSVGAPAQRSDEITFGVRNAAVPLPPSGGRIYEPVGKPVFERELNGEPVGAPLRLEWRGNPISMGMYVESYVVWSGTHFLYPFSESDLGPTHDEYVQLLLPIDCRP